jgi:hypothetical protein
MTRGRRDDRRDDRRDVAHTPATEGTTMIGLLIWLIVVVLLAGAVLAVVRAVLATPLFATVQPYANVVYALAVLLILVIAVQQFYAWGPPVDLGWPARHR